MKGISFIFSVAILSISLAGKQVTKGGEEFNTRGRTLDAIYKMRVHNFDATRVSLSLGPRP